MKPKSIFAILDSKYPNLKESVDLNKYKSLTDKVKITESDTHVYFENVPIAFGDTENKNKRVYDQKSLKKAVDQYNNVKRKNPYFGYIFDGHSDEDTYHGVVGKMIKMQTDDDLKVVMGNFKINKGAQIYPLLENIIKDGDPIGVSMRIIAPNSYRVKKSELKQMNEDILWLEDDDESVAKMFNGDEIEYITGDAYIWRVDLTQFPSFNNAYAQAGVVKDESANIKKVLEAACLVKEKYVCLTDTCKYRYTMRDFIDMINKDESIVAIKDNPDLYDDIMKFAYFNMTDFNFNEIDDRKYLQKHIDSDDNIDREFINSAIDNINKIVDDSIFKYIKENIDSLQLKDIVEKLYDTLIKLTENENIFYQIIIVNYIHWLLLANLLYNKQDTKTVEGLPEFLDKLKLNENDKKYAEYLANLMTNLEKNNNDLYSILNSIFMFMYNILDNFGDKLSPNILLSETAIKLKDIKPYRKIFKVRYTIMAKKKKCKKKKKK